MSNVSEHFDEIAPKVFNPDGRHPFVLICEHACPAMPSEFNGLGLDDAQLGSHIAWDPGALATATRLSELLDAPLIHTTVSRLIYDCNRPPDALDAMPARSEATNIPGNQALTESDKKTRVEMFYRPFERLIAGTLDARPHTLGLFTVHSFTPVYLGVPRPVEVGILHDDDARLADALLGIASGYVIARNQPYGPEDGVTHTLRRHALPRGLLNVMIEIRNDLLATPGQCTDMAGTLADWLAKSLKQLATQPAQEAAK